MASDIVSITCPDCDSTFSTKITYEMDFKWKMPGGMVLFIANGVDWSLCAEIFFDKCYDVAFNRLRELAPANRPLRVVDLGANVGFFTLLAADVMALKQQQFLVECVEPSSKNLQTLLYRLSNQAKETPGSFKIIAGAVGRERSGEAMFHTTDFHPTCTLENIPNTKTGEEIVSYIDLDNLIQPGTIDFLKCDIEGSEEGFTKIYQDTLLKRVQNCIMEVHADRVRIDNILEHMCNAGFTKATEVFSRGLVSLWFWSR